MQTWRNIPGLDGLRALAVASVLLFHFESKYFPGGYLGVTVFFALSGYLITGILVSEHERRGTISRRAFYIRRALRLYPALTVAVVIALVLAMILGHRGVSTTELYGAAGASLVYVNDFVLAASNHLTGWLDPTWSLGVEEQFYLLWPLILLVALARCPRALLGRWCLLAAVCAGVLAGVLFRPVLGATVTYFSPIGSLMPLLLGCGIALARPRLSYGQRQFLPWLIGAGAVALSALLLKGPLPETSLAWWGPQQLAAVETGLVILWFANGLAVPPLRWRPIVWLGRRSYGIYLFHYPILQALTTGTSLSQSEIAVIGIVLSICAAAASYRFLERPFLALKSRFDTTKNVLPGSEGSFPSTSQIGPISHAPDLTGRDPATPAVGASSLS